MPCTVGLCSELCSVVGVGMEKRLRDGSGVVLAR